MNWRAVAFVAVWAVLAPAGALPEEIRGAVEVVDGDTLAVGGVALDLAGIRAPVPGTICEVAGKAIDCGRIATTALMDLTAGARVVCRTLGDGHGEAARPARCTAGGYDLSEGMAYTGWAVADPPGTSRYARHERDARTRGRGMWRRRR